MKLIDKWVEWEKQDKLTAYMVVEDLRALLNDRLEDIPRAKSMLSEAGISEYQIGLFDGHKDEILELCVKLGQPSFPIKPTKKNASEEKTIFIKNDLPSLIRLAKKNGEEK